MQAVINQLRNNIKKYLMMFQTSDVIGFPEQQGRSCCDIINEGI